jgi:hypothetical protein
MISIVKYPRLTRLIPDFGQKLSLRRKMLGTGKYLFCKMATLVEKQMEISVLLF